MASMATQSAVHTVTARSGLGELLRRSGIGSPLLVWMMPAVSSRKAHLDARRRQPVAVEPGSIKKTRMQLDGGEQVSSIGGALGFVQSLAEPRAS